MFRAIFFAHHQEHITVTTASGNVHRPMLLLLRTQQQQPATTSVDITRSCSYSDMLLMMGEKNRPKHVELIKD